MWLSVISIISILLHCNTIWCTQKWQPSSLLCMCKNIKLWIVQSSFYPRVNVCQVLWLCHNKCYTYVMTYVICLSISCSSTALICNIIYSFLILTHSYSCHDTICTTAIASSWHTNVIGRIGSGQDLNSCNTLAMHLKLHKKRNEQSKVYYVQTWVIFQKESFVFSSFPMNWLWTQIFAFFKFRVPTTGSNIIVSINRLNYCKMEASLNTAVQFETSSTDLLYSFLFSVLWIPLKWSSLLVPKSTQRVLIDLPMVLNCFTTYWNQITASEEQFFILSSQIQKDYFLI